MMVLLLKQMHLQKEVAVDLALRVGWRRQIRIRRRGNGEDRRRIMDGRVSPRCENGSWEDSEYRPGRCRLTLDP